MNRRNCISLLIIVIFCGFVQVMSQTTTKTTRTTEAPEPGWDSDENYEVPDAPKYGNKPYPRDDDDDYGRDKGGYDDDDEYGYDSPKYPPSREKREPDEYGNMNIYFHEPSRNGKSKKMKKIRFPVHRFKKGHFPPLPPLISFLPWLPIFADKLTKQTIIFSPTGGLYIIPPVINIYGQMFSVAQLIASGYCSLVSGVAPLPPAINVAPLVSPGAVTGPGIPPPNKATGGFNGGVQTQFSSFPKTNYGQKGGY